jgi:hypothetical protein
MSSRAVQHGDAAGDGGIATFRVRFGAHEATGVRVWDSHVLPAALVAAGLPVSRPVVVVVGGAGGLASAYLEGLAPVFTAGLVPAIEGSRAVVVDGGTDSGVMRILGQARGKGSHGFRLVGVVADGTVKVRGGQVIRDDAADLEPHHTDFVIVPGMEWGAESPWISLTATAIAAGQPTVTVLVNGGEIAYADVWRSLDVGRPVLVLAGSGRTADEIAGALRGEVSDRRAVAIAASGLVRSVPAGDPSMLRDAVVAALETSSN